MLPEFSFLVEEKYVKVVQNMYKDSMTMVSYEAELMHCFKMEVGLH